MAFGAPTKLMQNGGLSARRIHSKQGAQTIDAPGRCDAVNLAILRLGDSDPSHRERGQTGKPSVNRIIHEDLGGRPERGENVQIQAARRPLAHVQRDGSGLQQMDVGAFTGPLVDGHQTRSLLIVGQAHQLSVIGCAHAQDHLISTGGCTIEHRQQ